MATAKEKTKKKVSKPKYEVSVINMGKTYTSSSTNLSDAFVGLNLRESRGKAIVIVRKGDVVKEKIVQPRVLNQIFMVSESSQRIALKQLLILFEGL